MVAVKPNLSKKLSGTAYSQLDLVGLLPFSMPSPHLGCIACCSGLHLKGSHHHRHQEAVRGDAGKFSFGLHSVVWRTRGFFVRYKLGHALYTLAIKNGEIIPGICCSVVSLGFGSLTIGGVHVLAAV